MTTVKMWQVVPAQKPFLFRYPNDSLSLERKEKKNVRLSAINNRSLLMRQPGATHSAYARDQGYVMRRYKHGSRVTNTVQAILRCRGAQPGRTQGKRMMLFWPMASGVPEL